MPRLPGFKVKKTDKGWLVNVPGSLSDTKKLQRRYFPTREKANTFSQSLRKDFIQHGEGASVLPPRVAGDAYEAWRILEPLGKTLTEAARFLSDHLERLNRSAQISEASRIYCESKDHQSDSQVKINRLLKEAIQEEFGERLMATFRTDEIMEFLDDRTDSPAYYNQWVRVFSAFWRWCAKPPRCWCDAEIVQHLESRESISGTIDVLRFKTVESIMRTAEKFYPDTVPAYAIALFSGMRRIEIERLDPEEVEPHGVSVSPSNSRKTRKRRFIQMNEPLEAWLKAYPVQGTVVPTNWHRKDRAVRRLAGFRVWSDLIDPNEAPESLPPWPGGAFRHTAATVAVALEKPIEMLVFEHGHTGGLGTLRQHYVGLMPKAEALKIWNFRPLRK